VALPLVFGRGLTHADLGGSRGVATPKVKPGLKKFIQGWLINTLAVLIAVVILRGHIRGQGMADLFVAALLLGVLNTFLRPILLLLTLPLLIFSLGLFTIVINACLLYVVHWLMGSHFEIDGFGWALLGAVIMSLISVPLNILTGSGSTRMTFRRQTRPPASKSDDSDGPVIDV